MLGWYDALAAISLHSIVGDVEGVAVRGLWLKKEGKVVYPGNDGIKKLFLESAKKIQGIWGAMEWQRIDVGLWQNETEWGSVREMDTLRAAGKAY